VFPATLAVLKDFQLTAWGRYGLAAAGGGALALAFAPAQIAGAAWVAPALMVAAARGRGGAEAFRIGYVAGLVHFLTSLSWLLHIPVRGYPVLGWLALSAYLALYPAAWVWATTARGAADAGCPGRGEDWTRRTLWAVGGAAGWVALEMVRARLFGGFPWNLIGVSQSALLPLIQVASVTGVYGVSFLVVWLSLGLFNAACALARQPARRYVWLGEILLPAAAVGVVFSSGLRQLHHAADGPRALRVTFVQPSIPQTLIWDPQENRNRFRQLLELTETALARAKGQQHDPALPRDASAAPPGQPGASPGPENAPARGRSGAPRRAEDPAAERGTDLLLWPEAAVPQMLRHDAATRRAVTNLARAHGVWMILGSDDAALRPGGQGEQDVDYFNASFLVSPQGEILASYRKNHLVAFGEFVPLARWLPFLRRLTPIGGGFTPGRQPVPFVLDALALRPSAQPADAAAPAPAARAPGRVKTATVICFEDVFPHLVRRHMEADTDFLVNLTNDGWFGQSAAQWQHAANALFRAVENGRPLLRCCNNGLTCWVDAAGRIRATLRDATGSVYGAGFLTTEVPLRVAPAGAARTVYSAHGDWFGWACVGIALLPWAGRIRAGGRTWPLWPARAQPAAAAGSEHFTPAASSEPRPGSGPAGRSPAG